MKQPKNYYKKANKSYDKANAKRIKAINKREKGKISDEKARSKVDKAFAKHEKTMKAFEYSGNSPAMRKLSASCKAAARAKFDVYPSAYANMWASKQQGKGKC